MKSETKIDGDRLQITRLFDAPRHVVFSWWASAERLQQWSGCKEAIACEVTMDFRVGGSFTQRMQIDANGRVCELVLRGKYMEIVEPERIVYELDFGNCRTTVAVQFFGDSAGTRMVLTHEGCPNELFCKTISQGTVDSFEKLELLLTEAVPAALRT